MREHSVFQSSSPWMESDMQSAFTPLTGEACADVCIVGAGISGLTTAYCLLKEGRSVIVLDDNPIGYGESVRTTAHISHALDDRYFGLEKIHGESGIKQAAESHTRAIEKIEEIVLKEGIQCEFERLDGYLFLADNDPVDILSKELEAVHTAGLTEVELLDHLSLGERDAGPALRFPGQATFHILRYLQGLAEAIVEQGGIIHTGTHVSKVEGGNPCRTETSEGHVVTSQDIVLATNVPIKDNVQIYAKQAAYRTYVIGCTIPKGSVENGLYWDTSGGEGSKQSAAYHYIRLWKQSKEDLLIIGGEDAKTGQHDDADARFNTLELWARNHFPMIQDIRWKWSGQVMESADGLAFIGKNPGDPNHMYIATGDSGNGITHGTIAGMLLTDLILGVQNPWAELYNPTRTRFHAFKEIVKENTNVAKEMVEGYILSDAVDAEDLSPNSGAVVRRGIKKIALSRDAEGTLREFSAVCPHRGCIVQWNSYEKSFDCPCHGSRFDAEGKVLNGPTAEGLSLLVS